jgi:hypothetical protein
MHDMIACLLGASICATPTASAPQFVMNCHAATLIVDDVDGDHCEDIVFGDPNANDARGRVWVFSGRTGATLHRIEGEEPKEGFGCALGVAGDLGGDGRREVLVGSDVGNGGRSFVTVLDVVHAKRLRKDVIESREGGIYWLGLLDDGDDDSVFEYFVAGDYDNGSLQAMSGATGRALWRVGVLSGLGHVGQFAIRGNDVDGDGRADVLVSASPSHVVALSGRTGAELFRATDEAASILFGSSLCLVPDVDGDGRGDFAVGDRGEDTDQADALTGRVTLNSGVTGKKIATLQGGSNEAFGASVCMGPDMDGDGAPELCVGATYFKVLGGVEAYSLKTRQRVSDWKPVESMNSCGWFGAWLGSIHDGNPSVDETARALELLRTIEWVARTHAVRRSRRALAHSREPRD